MKNFSLLMGALAFLMVGVDAASAQSENAATPEEVELSATFYNECCDELIVGSGTFNLLFRGNGFHLNAKRVTGLTPDGKEYRVRVIENFRYDTNDNNAQQSGVYHLRFVFTADDGCTFTQTLTAKITVTATGNVVIDYREVGTECEGTDLS